MTALFAAGSGTLRTLPKLLTVLSLSALTVQTGCKVKPKAAPPTNKPAAAVPNEDHQQASWIANNYEKRRVNIPMRDGVQLNTIIYRPKNQSGPLPILFQRTPYSTGPVDPDLMPQRLGPSLDMAKAGYIFVYQDVRGTFMSEGEFVNMRPQLTPTSAPQNPSTPPAKPPIDESTDTYDSIEWMTRNVEKFNGKVGMWGISYPGFYAAAGMINAHPALAAVSPQAPIADWYFDDFHHHGAFFLPHAFNFLAMFGKARKGLTTEWNPRFDHKTKDGYAFFSRLGPLKNANDRYLHNEIAFWNDMVEHPNRDEFWQARDILPHLHNTAPAVMTVGGWYDAEDLYGPLKIYEAVEKNNPKTFNVLVMGPWIHGGWARGDGQSFGDFDFGSNTSKFYQQNIELPFFEHFLKGKKTKLLPEAYMFETGSNQWRTFNTWPPATTPASFYFEANGGLAQTPPTQPQGYDEFTSDPENPVPFTQEISVSMVREYMIEDQRFADRRPDVLSFQTPPLDQDLTLAGELYADLWVSTSAQDADWIIKLIDVLPPNALEKPDHPKVAYAEYQRMVRSEVFRGRYREGYNSPKPFVPNQPTKVRIPLQDILHTFKKGHRIMVQVQSTWFPLVDRNPQSWVDNIFKAEEKDFVKAQHRVYRDKAHPSKLEVKVLKAGQ